jgi:hypothetical protein
MDDPHGVARHRPAHAGAGAGLGAPAEVTARSIGSGSPCRASTSISAGEPNRRSTPKRCIASISLRGSARAGRVGSMSGMTEVRPSAGSNSAKGGKVGRSTPPGAMPKALRSRPICATKCRWRYTTPFGKPVEPEVKRMPATSSGAVSASWGPAPAPRASISASVGPPQNQRRPTVTCLRAAGAQRSNLRAACASAMPMKASGSASARQRRSADFAMPGSTSTGTAPSLNSANISRKNSGVGRTITTVRAPRPMP